MRYWIVCVLLCTLTHSYSVMAQLFDGSGGNSDLESRGAVPATCRASPHVLMGTPIKWQVLSSGELVDGENCSFTMGDSILNASSFVTALPGDYHYECPDMGVTGNMTVTQAQYSVAICSECTNYSNNNYRLNSGEVVQWSFIRRRETVDCPTQLWKDGRMFLSMDNTVRSYQFTSPGTYQIICKDDPSLATTIVVMELSQVPSSRLLPLLYTHAALMIAAFGFLLPLGAFLAYNQVKLAHKIVQPIGLLLALAGFVLVVVFVQLTHGSHFRYLIHSVVGLVLLILALFAMPLLLLKKPRVWHKKTGQVVAFFGMGNVLLGLAVFPVSPTAGLVICALYGVWLLVALTVYIFVPRSSKKVSSYSLSSPTGREMEEIANHTRNSSFSSLKGPQRLEKNIISDDKMVQLRKKSMDFLESTRQRDLLHMEFANHPLYNKPYDAQNSYNEDRPDSKPDQESEFEDLENSRAPLCHMTSHMDSSFPPTPEDELATDEKVRMYLANSDGKGQSTDDLDERDASMDDLDDRVQSTEDLRREVQSADELETADGTKITRAQTFNINHSSPHLIDNEPERGGSLRITRHSRRARRGMDDVFPQVLTDEPRPADPDKAMTLPVHLTSTPTPEGTGRRRKAGFLPPPIIMTTPVETTDSPVVPGCPFHAGLSVKNGRRGLSQSPRPARRGISPTPSGDSVFDASPRPLRKKKVSVAQIEATVVPPTPVNLLPPSGLTRSASHDTIRTHHDVFTDNAFRSVMHISQDAIVCANSVGDIVFWSSGASRMFGYTPGEAIGSNLEMIVPLSFREKHRTGINNRTGNTLKYLRKHSYAPEEQKHARLYEVRALTKSGHEIPAEVHVTSFVIEGELFYTGVITEMTRKTGGGSIGSTSDINELSLKQRALAVGAQMRFAHNLMHANHISREELERVLVSSLRAADFEVESYQTEQMVTGIMKEGDPESSGAVSFVNLIKLLSKHQLYISESGNIARYGKTMGPQGEDVTRLGRATSRMKEFLVQSSGTLLWLLTYLLLNLVLFALGVGASEGTGIRRVAYGAGPVLSCNCVIVLLPTLYSLCIVMTSSIWMNKYLPLKKTTLIHILISCGILFWSLFHITTHFVSFAVHTDNATSQLTTQERFTANLRAHLFPTITGFVVLTILLFMAVSSIPPVRKIVRFLPFTISHWLCLVVFYLLLVVHGINYYNPSFWKWLLPFAVLVVLERVYRYAVIPRHFVKIKSAGRYDDQSRTAIIELEKPSRFKFEPGQFILLNIPWIGHFNWQPCQISSGPKDKNLTIYLPHSSEPWVSQAFSYLKKHPYHMPKTTNQKKEGKSKNKEGITMETTGDNHPAAHKKIQFSGPFGPTYDSQLLFDYKISTLVCAGDAGPHCAKAIIKKFLEYRKGSTCHCGLTPSLSKLYFIWVVPSGNDFEWFTDYLSELCEDEHVHRYLDVRVFLTNINSPPDELASALLQLGLKTAGPHCIVRRPSQPQLNNLHSKTSYGVPDFPALLDYISAQNAAMWSEGGTEFGVFTLGTFHHAMSRDLMKACKTSSKPGQLQYTHHHIHT